MDGGRRHLRAGRKSTGPTVLFRRKCGTIRSHHLRSRHQSSRYPRRSNSLLHVHLDHRRPQDARNFDYRGSIPGRLFAWCENRQDCPKISQCSGSEY